MTKNRNNPVMRRLGISTFMGCAKTLESFFQRCATLGVGFVEVQCEKPLALPVDVSPLERKQIRELLTSYALTPIVHASYYDVNIASLNPQIGTASMQQIQEAIIFAADIDATIVDLHPGNLPRDYPKRCLQKSRKNLLKQLSHLMEIAENLQVIVSVENKQRGHNLQTISTVDEQLAIIREISSKYCRATFDVGHANTYSCDLNDYARRIVPYLVNVHLHDNNGTKDEHLALGRGNIDFKSILNILDAVQYSGPFIIEVKSWAGIQSSIRTITKLVKK
jgi:sugar phosphate isomerase/epimerase